MRRTMRGLAETARAAAAQVPSRKHPRRPEIYVLCDVSIRDSRASLLSSFTAHDSFRKLAASCSSSASRGHRGLQTRARLRAISERISRRAASRTSPLPDYGSRLARVPRADRHDSAPLDGDRARDARTNGPRPTPAVFAQITDAPGRTFWLNPEPRCTGTTATLFPYERYCTRPSNAGRPATWRTSSTWSPAATRVAQPERLIPAEPSIGRGSPRR